MIKKIHKFFTFDAASGLVLILCSALALFMANLSYLSYWYKLILELPFVIQLGPLLLKKNFLLLVNDGLMAIFFLLVAIEIKQEIKDGHLSSFKQAFLPCAAALGGVFFPAVIFLLCAPDAIARQGWAIPAATDIAFSLGILALVGSRVPKGLKVFITTVAVIDDLAAICIIAIFYTSHLSVIAITLAALGVLGLFLLNRRNVRTITPYILFGVFIWICVLKSGVHATLAGVLVGLAIPTSNDTEETESPSSRVENYLHVWVSFGILPLFAFVNAGVNISSLPATTGELALFAGIFLGLCVGKPIGVYGTSYALIRSGLAEKPKDVQFSHLLAGSLLTGIGFTMSLFIGSLAFENQLARYGSLTKISVIAGSLFAAVTGYLAVLWTVKREAPADIQDSFQKKVA